MRASQKYSILVVEDEADLLEMYRIKLTSEGFDVLTALNGQAGFDMVKKHLPDLVLLDLIMPKFDGYAMLKMMKRNRLTGRIAVIVFSNLSQSDEVEKGFKLGARDYILKTSLTPRQLSDKVKEFLKQYPHSHGAKNK